MRKQTIALAALTLIFLTASIIVWSTASFDWTTIFNPSGVNVQPNFKGVDKDGNIVQFSLPPDDGDGDSLTPIYKVQISAVAKVDMVGMASASVKWWADYQIDIRSLSTSKEGTYDAWEGGWSSDSGWSPYWKDWFTVTAGGSFDFEPCKKAYWMDGWRYNFADGWISLDPNTVNSMGDWIKWSGGLGETPNGKYEVKVSLHVKVNYKDNYGKEKTAIGPSGGGELRDFLVFQINYQLGVPYVLSILPSFSWTPLDFSNFLSDQGSNLMTSLASFGLPAWTLHVVFPALTTIFGISTAYSHKKEKEE